ncbi:MAG: hypothetical protein ACRD1D_04410 [Acidimicrobiales bacterium]
MKVRKVVQRKGKGPVAAVNAVVAATLGESGEDSVASNRQHVKIVQRGGETVVHEHIDDAGDPDQDGRGGVAPESPSRP